MSEQVLLLPLPKNYLHVWIPAKQDIEMMIQRILDDVRKSDNLSDIEGWIQDELSSIECHISNRASVELGLIGD